MISTPAICLIVIVSSFLFQLLQNLGKADKTTDEIFEEHYLNFNIQQANATRLQKDIANYIRCIKGKDLDKQKITIIWNGTAFDYCHNLEIKRLGLKCLRIVRMSIDAKLRQYLRGKTQALNF